MVGASLALALAGTGRRVALIEAVRRRCRRATELR